MNVVENYLENYVQVYTTEGRVFTGVLISFDNSSNLVLRSCKEKVFSDDEEGTTLEDMGMFFIRGDNVCMVAKLDDVKESATDYSALKHPGFPEIKIL